MSLLTLDNTTMKFGGLTAVEEVSLCVEEGEIFGLIGPNGAGKTTVFNMITGHYKPTNGSILFKENEITGLPPDRITRIGIARTFQNIRLFKDLTVLENVMVSQHHTIASNGAALSWLLRSVSRIGYADRESEMKAKALDLLSVFGIERHSDEKSSSLPYGSQRLLEIARAMATGSILLLLDEPAAGMNPSETASLVKTIRRIRDDFGLTILLIEHDMKLVMGLCERIMVLDHGRTISEGDPAFVQKDVRVIEAYLGREWVTVGK
ncbi:MAG: ABC transporter ATP-binding protein [Mesotoga sp.]|uniref:ABC transporter ATP-binding protein n=1 Tax=Mesotoga sp. TaxID=2053577 RepID=UPI001691EA50|nr:ABC transporter ATP-binding protein [Mesotoga sp.]MDI9367028.1 ABC transporter ATP-binding protein [Thermotogota bacterium]NLT44158.1 ABC transporter ATP-binding protein [Thermotogaceae bacterium]MDD2333032.1 ABC transporter ATP-binding protein [Mesotoga sp.]MDD3680632.1 ABC transporter ATP-binding protein [Mesotoga sp.]MDD4207528.1 ABC transporter ATP-binding protein [Mesotoga sp.]